MPLSTLAKAGIAAAVAGGAWLWSGREAKRRKKVKRAPSLPSYLIGIYGPRQALIPDIYNNLNINGQRTADQFFGFNLTPDAQGKLFELLAEVYVGDIQTYVGDAAVAALSELQPAEWGATGTLATQEVVDSAEALAMVVLADLQDVVIPFEQPPLDLVIDHEADLCVREIYELAPVGLHPEILPELSEAAAELGASETFHLNDVAQATAFLHLTSLAANEPGVWATAPIVSTLRAIGPGCAWERKDHYTSQMADVYYDVEALRDIVATDIM